MRAHLPSPRAHCLLLALSLVVMLGLLLLDPLVVHRVGQGEAPTAGPADRVPESVRTGGPLIGTDGNGLTSRSVPDGAVVLTFDDGPDPRWTPQVLDVLRRNDVKATFLVTGVAAARYPDLVERMADEGHEVGLHTFTHVDLGAVGEARTALELMIRKLRAEGRQFRTASDALGVPIARSASFVEQAEGDGGVAGRARCRGDDLADDVAGRGVERVGVAAGGVVVGHDRHPRAACAQRRASRAAVAPATGDGAGARVQRGGGDRGDVAHEPRRHGRRAGDRGGRRLTDRTSEVVRALDLPRVTLVRQANAGKAAALAESALRTARTILDSSKQLVAHLPLYL